VALTRGANGGKFMRKVVLWVVLAGFLAGCNTMAGFGRDVETLGDKIERKAKQ